MQDEQLDDPSVYEETHVHSVYESIADHFSATRYSPWPLVARFLEAQPAGSLGLDVGCGNGKYLSGASGRPDAAGPGSGPSLYMLGSDRSTGLATLARDKHARGQPGADVLLADSLALPFRDQCADFVICIAVVHHLSTRQRRQAAVRELLRCVRPRLQQEPQDATSSSSSSPESSSSSLSAGSVLVYVWALEQASSRRGWAAGGDQDLLVPWVKTMKDRTKESKQPLDGARTQKGRGKKQQKQHTQATGPETTTPATPTTPAPPPETVPKDATTSPHVPPTYHRYYHLYREGELEEDVAAAGGRVVAHGYERDNWWVVVDVAVAPAAVGSLSIL